MTKIKFLLFILCIFLGNLSATKWSQVLKLEPETISKNSDSIFHLSNLIAADFEIENLAKILVDAYLQKRTISDFPNTITTQQAQAIQDQLIQGLIPYQGKIIGYKAGLTNAKAQERFNVSQPVLGVFLEQMLLPSGSTVPSNFGAVPMLEGDLIVRVGDEKINQARTPEETLNYLDAVIPFLELPDLVYDKTVQLKGEMLVAINVGARLGIVGTPIPLKKIDLKNIQITIIDGSGEILAQGNSNVLLGNPLNVIFWIKEQLHTQGKMLKKGDLLSLGSMTPLIPVTDTKTVYAKYQGLGNNESGEISVIFKE